MKTFLFLHLAPEMENVLSENTVTGLRLIENFLTDDQEKLLLENIDWEEDGKRKNIKI